MHCSGGRDSLEGGCLIDSINPNGRGGRLGVQVGVHADKTMNDFDLGWAVIVTRKVWGNCLRLTS